MHRFHEGTLVNELAALPSSATIAFATAVATRQLGNYDRFMRWSGVSPCRRPREIADQLWADLPASAVDRAPWTEKLGEVMSLMPEESGDWAVSYALADDALASLAYAIRCLLNRDPKEAAWAARRAYEAADQVAIIMIGAVPGLPGTEALIASHDVVQRELARQQRDLASLRANSIGEVQRHAVEEELLTEEEALSLKRN